jgi:hypothetical protein
LLNLFLSWIENLISQWFFSVFRNIFNHHVAENWSDFVVLFSVVRRIKLHALANATKSPNWWKGLCDSLIHFNTPTHVWREKTKSTRGQRQEKRKSTRGHKGGNSNFYNKLRKPGLKLETLGSDTMLSFIH